MQTVAMVLHLLDLTPRSLPSLLLFAKLLLMYKWGCSGEKQIQVCRRSVSLQRRSRDLQLFRLLLLQIYKRVQELELYEMHALSGC